jgi:hypothetical protein
MGWLLTQVEAEVVVEVPILIRINRRVTVGDLGMSSGAGARGGGTLPPPFNFLIPMVSFLGSHCTPSLDQGRCISQVNTRGRGRGRGFSNLSRGQDPCSSGTET